MLQDAAARRWAAAALEALSLRARVAQLVASPLRGAAHRAGDRVGSVIVAPDDSRRVARTLAALQTGDGVPVLAIARGDPSAGEALLVGLPQFPTLLGLAAVNDTMASCAAGRALARTARDHGVHGALVAPPGTSAADAGGDTGRALALRRALRPLTTCAANEGFALLSEPETSGERLVSHAPRLAQLDSSTEKPPSDLVAALAAGHDMVVVRDHTGPAIDSAVRAITDGRLSQARVDSAVERLLYLKARLGLALEMPDAQAPSAPNALAADSLAASLARRSIVLARDRQLLAARPLDDRSLQDVRVIIYLHGEARTGSARAQGQEFVRELRRLSGRGRAHVVRTHVVTPRTSATALRSITALARRADLVILASFLPPFREHDTTDISTNIAAMQGDVIARQRYTVSVVFGEPDSVSAFPLAGTILVGWSPYSPWSERAAARVVAGVEMPAASLPVDFTTELRAGERALFRRFASPEGFANSRRLRRTPTPAMLRALRDTVRQLLERAVADSAFPGAFAVVGTRRTIIARHGAGQLDWGERSRPTGSTLWDLASLTKVIGMTSGIARLVGQGRISLDEPVQRYLPDWTGPGKEAVTVRHLLTHSSGLPAWSALYRDATSREEAVALVYAMPLDTLPGARMVYSDLGAILLGEIIARVSGEPLDQYLTRHVFKPLGMRNTMFRPAERLLARIAPTEVDPWRGRHLRGEVHDENAFRLGGVSGHAGLFSTADDLTRFARMLLGGGMLDGRRIIAKDALDAFVEIQNAPLSTRALGWDTPSGGNSAGHLVSTRAFGHTGFTGTSLWIDPANDVFVLLLTNRVNPSRENQRIGAVRVALADAVMSVLTVPRGLPEQPRQP